MKNRLLRSLPLLAGLCLASAGAMASGMDRLKAFVEGTRAGRADFTQVTTHASGKSEAPSTGVFEFSRPGKFRWEYRKPYPQTIVGDGHTLWIWDPDLKQVTRKKLAESLGSTPAAILAGENALEKGFRLSDDGTSDGLEWVLALPKTAESGFQRIRLGFNADSLARMDLKDSFGHTISIRFGRLDKTPHFSSDTFQFTPPSGSDIIE
jgi:outer membrane lipoprotein carrier protein